MNINICISLNLQVHPKVTFIVTLKGVPHCRVTVPQAYIICDTLEFEMANQTGLESRSLGPKLARLTVELHSIEKPVSTLGTQNNCIQ